MLQNLDHYIGQILEVFWKNVQHIFPKMGGGVKGRVEFFRKFICFGSLTRPLGKS